jgi:hypothetical protein
MVSATVLRRARLAGAILALAALALPSAAPASRRSPSIHVTNIKLTAVWKQGWLTATIKFSIVVSDPSDVAATIRPTTPGPVAAHKLYSFSSGGTFAEAIKLPARLLPKQYDLKVSGSSGTSALPPFDGLFTIPSPAEGIVDTAAVSATKGGKATKVLAHPKTLWVRFHFLVPPKAKTVKVEWRTPSYTYVGAVTKPYAATIDSFVSATTTMPPGTWYAILLVNGKIAKRQDVRVT